MTPGISAITPLWAVAGGRIAIHGRALFSGGDRVPSVRLGDEEARVVFASPSELHVIVPPGIDGRVPVRVADVPGATAFLDVGAEIATGVHVVDNPVFDRHGTLYATFSGSRSQQSAVTIYRLHAGRAREPFVTSIAHPTSMTIGPDGALYVSDRFEGAVYRVGMEGRVETIATDLGVPCGIVFAPEGSMYVGDRSGSVVRIDTRGVRTTVAEIPASIAAFHLAWGPDDRLYLSAPTLGTRDTVYRVSPDGAVEPLPYAFGRPQGLAFDRQGRLCVCDALAGSSGIFRIAAGARAPERIVAAPAVIGLCFDPAGGLVVAAPETIYRLAVAA